MNKMKDVLEKVYNNLELRQNIVPLFIGDPGLGKEISVKTPVLTKQGWKEAGDIKKGDIFYDDRGKETKVIGVHPQGIKRNFKLTFNDGYTTNCGLEHLWNVKTVKQKDYKTLSLKEILDKGVLQNLSEARKNSNRKAIPRFIIPITEPVNFTEKELFISPYTMGTLIADGSLTRGVIYSTHIDDDQITKKVINSLSSSYVLKSRKTSEKGMQHRISNYENHKNNEYWKYIQSLNLNVHSNKRFIPEIYKFGSVAQRIELLRGLMDSDGTVSEERNKVSYSTSSETLAKDVVELVQSLGGLARILSYKRKDKNKEYIVVIKINICPFSLDRKKIRWSKSKFTRRLVNVEEIDPVDSVCFTVDSPSKLFLIENYIVTHNTVVIEQFAKEKGVKLVELITSQMSPFEISGIAMPDKESKKMTYFNFDKLESLVDGDILFFDELLNGNPVVLNACLTILEQRRFISGKPLPNIMIVAAANHQGMTPLTPQIKERFVWYDVKFNAKMWKEYMRNKYAMPFTISAPIAELIMTENYKGNNFNSPRSIDKAVNMIIHEVETPYRLLPYLNKLIQSPFDEIVELPNGRELAPNEQINWLDLMKLNAGINIDKL